MTSPTEEAAMTRARIQEIVRQFPQNGLRLLLHHPANVRDLLSLAGLRLLDRLDFARLKVDPTSYVGRDYRHVESDLVLKVPLRHQPGDRVRRTVLLYLLIEHQSEPDPLMTFRVLEYLVAIWRSQVRTWQRSHPSLAGLRFRPILPVVVYTGIRPWPALGTLTELLEQGELLREVTPAFQPLFVNLPDLPAERLASAGGYFGWVLELVQQRQREQERFQLLLGHVVQHLETMPAAERLRWLELLSYIEALLYHERNESEHGALQETSTDSVGTDDRRGEVRAMRRSMADVHREEARKRETVRRSQQILLRQLRRRFGDLPPQVERTIKAMKRVTRLDAWLDRVVDASTLEDMGIGSDD